MKPMSWRRALLVVCCIALLTAGYFAWRAHKAIDEARALADRGLWKYARSEVSRYLWLHPNDAEARLFLAEMYAQDNSLEPVAAAREAVMQLERIPDDSPRSSEARVKQGSLEFLMLNQPVRAERSARAAIALKPESPDAYRLLLMLLEMTDRHDLSAPVFWEVYDRTQPNERISLLREWYLNQFFPLSAHQELDRAMGFLGPSESPNRTTESRRYLRYREKEPNGPLGYAALAMWCHPIGRASCRERV